jgi:transitional endoplasmic reticulum ATPase
MTDNRNRIEFSTLPTWAERFIDDLDDRFGVLSGEMAAKNFPDGEAPPWLRAKSLDGSPSAPRWIDSFFARADRSLQQLWIEKGFLSTDPEWLADLTRRDEADVARVFLLTGNVNDYAFSPAYGYKPVIDRLEESAKHRKEWVIRYSLSNGFSRPTRGDSTPEDADSPFEELGIEDIDRRNSSSSPREALNEDFRIMESLLTGGYDGSICLIVDNIHMLVPSDSSTLNRHVLTDAVQRWAQSPAMFQSDNQVILMADSTEALNRELRSGSSHIDTIELPWPDESDSRLKFLLSLFSGGRVRPMTGIRREATNVPRFGGRFGDRTSQRLQQLADRTSGLNLVGVENVVLQVDPPDPEPITLEFLKELKRDILSDESGGLLEVTEPDAGIDRSEAFNHVGGLDPVCTKLLEISRMMDEASNSETVRRSLPNGLLFLGPPGTGKTLVARAFANACGVNFAEFGNIRSMWVGESERNLSRALELIRSLKPVVVFLDEIDQSMGQRGSASDSGVDQRLFARILQFTNRLKSTRRSSGPVDSICEFHSCAPPKRLEKIFSVYSSSNGALVSTSMLTSGNRY